VVEAIHPISFCDILAVVAGGDFRTCIVEFRARGAKWANVTAASSTFEAVRTAYKFFNDPHWRGPKPNLDTIFEISLVGDERKWNVRVGAALNSPQSHLE
jgi:hypothetical protein